MFLAVFESYDMTARDNFSCLYRPGEHPVEPVSIWAAKNPASATILLLGRRAWCLAGTPGNEVDSQVRGRRSVRLTRTEDLKLQNNIFLLSGW
jgi:hypothetical protein